MFWFAWGVSWSCERGLTTNDSLVLSNGFAIHRGMLQYRQHLSSNFVKDLRALGPQERWLDVGAGSARAARDVFHDRFRGFMTYGWRPFVGQVVAYSMVKPKDAGLAGFEARVTPGRFSYREGSPIEAVKSSDLGQFEVISDVFAAMTYTPSPGGVLAKYAELARVGGRVYISIPVDDASSVLATSLRANDLSRQGESKVVQLLSLRDASGVALEFRAWLEAVRGFSVRVTETTGSLGRSLRVELVRTSEPFWAPELELVSNPGRGAPPPREFRLKD